MPNRYLGKEQIRQWEWQMQRQRGRSMHAVFEKQQGAVSKDPEVRVDMIYSRNWEEFIVI